MRLCACLVAFVFIACAPSVPRPMRQPPAPDAAVDLPAATTPVTVDARPDVRQPPEPAVDAHGDVLGEVARDAVVRTDAVPNTDVPSDNVARVDGRADAKPDTTKPDTTKADTTQGADSDNGLDAA